MQTERRSDRPTPGNMAFAEFASTDTASTRRFLEEVFGWKFESRKMPMGEYLSFRTPDGGAGGVRPTQPKEQPVSTNYVMVEDLTLAERRIRDEGGVIVLPRTDVPGMGSFFWFRIPGGPVMACWQDAPASRGPTSVKSKPR